KPSRKVLLPPPSICSTPTRNVTSITSPSARASWISSWRYPTRSASAATTRHCSSSNSEARRLIFLSDFLNAEVVDVRQHRVGRVRDLVVVMSEPFPKVTGVILKNNRKVRSLDWSMVRSWDNKELSLKVDAGSLQPHSRADTEPWLARQILDKQHPADLADIVNELSPDDRSAVFAALDDEKAADTLEEIDEPQMQASILERLDVERASDILEAMAPDEVADLLADMPRERAQQLLQKMEEDEAGDVEELLAYREDTAGGLMTTEYVAVLHSLTAAEAIERLRELEPDAESVYYVYVTDEEEHLLGVLSLRDLIVAKPETKIRDFMIKNVISVRLDAGPREVAEVTSKYNLLAVPVVDEHNRIHGIVTVDDV